MDTVESSEYYDESPCELHQVRRALDIGQTNQCYTVYEFDKWNKDGRF